jgi:hypothetical protein
MKTPGKKLLEKNQNIDKSVVDAVITLQKKLPLSENTKKGSDYRISPPFGGQALSLYRRGKEI